MQEADTTVDDMTDGLPGLPLIQATNHADEDDRTTQNISEIADLAGEAEDDAVSSPAPMSAAATAHGLVFSMEDVPARSNPSAARSDVSMAKSDAHDPDQEATQVQPSSMYVPEPDQPESSETREVQDESQAIVSQAERAQSSEPHTLSDNVASNSRAGTEEDAASNEAEAGGRSDVDDLSDLSDDYYNGPPEEDSHIHPLEEGNAELAPEEGSQPHLYSASGWV